MEAPDTSDNVEDQDAAARERTGEVCRPGRPDPLRRRAGVSGWLIRSCRAVGSVLWQGVVALGMYAFCPSSLPSSVAEAHVPVLDHRDGGLDSPPARHPERLVPYESLTSHERQIWTELEARVR